MRKTILSIEVLHYDEGAIPLLVRHHIQIALHTSQLHGCGYLAIKHRRKKGAQRKAFTLHPATLVLWLLRTHTGPLWNINIRLKCFKQARLTSCAVSRAPPLLAKLKLFPSRDEEEHSQERNL